MASEQINENRPEHRATTKPDGEAPWADLEVAIPNDRDHASLVSLVECALIELTHEHVGAVVVTHQVRGTNRTQYVAVDDVGEQFQKRHFDSRHGWYETIVPREPFATNSSPSSLDRHPRRQIRERQQTANRIRSP